MRPRARRRPDRVEVFKSGFIAFLVALWGALLLLLVVVFILVYGTAKAAAQIQVPPECVELARREGFPTDVMTKAQALRARLRLWRLSNRDPLAKPCRDAIEALRAQMRQQQGAPQ